MPAKRKGNRKRQNNEDEIDDVLKVGGKDEKINLTLAKKKRKSDEDEHKKGQSSDSTSADTTSTTEVVTGTMVTEDKEEEVRDDKIECPGAHLLLESEKVRANVLLEYIKFKSGERNDKDIAGNETLDPGNECKVAAVDVKGKTDCIYTEIGEAKIDSTNTSDDANITNTIPINSLKVSNELCLSGDVEKIIDPVSSIDHNINKLNEEKGDKEGGKMVTQPENKDLEKDSSDKALIDCQKLGSTLQDKDGPHGMKSEDHKLETTSTSKKMDIIMDHIESFAEQCLIGTSDKGGNDEITIAHESKETSNEILVNKEVIKDILINKDINFVTEFNDSMKQSKSTVTPNEINVENKPALDMPDGYEITSEQNKSEVLTDSQLCEFDWMSQFPEEQENCPMENSDQIHIMQTESGDADQQMEDGSTIIKTFIKELSNLNKMILKTKREIENARRQRKSVTK